MEEETEEGITERWALKIKEACQEPRNEVTTRCWKRREPIHSYSSKMKCSPTNTIILGW
jgi:hypothetical protein